MSSEWVSIWKPCLKIVPQAPDHRQGSCRYCFCEIYFERRIELRDDLYIFEYRYLNREKDQPWSIDYNDICKRILWGLPQLWQVVRLKCFLVKNLNRIHFEEPRAWAMTEGKWSKKRTAVEMTLVAVMRAESKIQNLETSFQKCFQRWCYWKANK